jgi:hypothetical protein
MTAKYRKTLTILLSFLIFSPSATLHAGGPVSTFAPLTATSISVTENSTATVQYMLVGVA